MRPEVTQLEARLGMYHGVRSMDSILEIMRSIMARDKGIVCLSVDFQAE